jgi:cytochrome c oxidase subunit 1
MPGLAKWQPYLFGIGTSILTLVMMGAGTLGVARRHWDMAFSGAPYTFEFGGAAYMMMGLTGIFGVVSVIGGAAFVIVIVGTLFFGKKIEDKSEYGTARPPILAMAPPAPAHGKGFAAPGTFVLALVFLATFVVYYFLNWMYLSSVWPMK